MDTVCYDVNSLSRLSNLDHQTQWRLYDNIKPLIYLENDVVIGFIVELGSNVTASQNLAIARQILSEVGDTAQWSTEFVNPDYTATIQNPKPDYTNQCGFITILDTQINTRFAWQKNNLSNDSIDKITLKQLVDLTKHIEKTISQLYKDSNKDNESDAIKVKKSIKPKSSKVVIDIDVLAVITDKDIIAIAERCPLKNHEWVGINELYNKGVFDQYISKKDGHN